jgi:hypothetical protein
MSHVVNIQLEIKDLEALEAACKALGLTYDRTANKWRWYGKWMNDYSGKDAAYKHGIEPSRYGTADAGVIRVPGTSYDVGVYKTKDGYALIYDNWQSGGGIEKVLGVGTPDLNKQYGAQVALKRLKKMGWRATAKETRVNGRLDVKVHALAR